MSGGQLAIDTLLLAGLLLATAVGPGLFILRRVAWKPLEIFSASLGLSLIFLYLCSLAIYALGLLPQVDEVVSGICLLLTVSCWRDFRRLLAHRSVRRDCAGFGVLVGWGLLLVSLVRHFSGGACYFDWVEHYYRACYFIPGVSPLHPQFLREMARVVEIPSRPPLLNVVGAFYLAQVGARYEVYQILFLVLNLLVYFPLMLLMPLFGRGARRNRVLLVGFLMASPLLWWNVSWPWTKVFAAFYVLLGLYFYLTGWRQRQWPRLLLGFVFLAAAILVHYSSVPYALAIGLHYLVVVWRPGSQGGRELLRTGGLAATLLLTWLAWSAAAYGVRSTFFSNTTALGFRQASVTGNLMRIVKNVYYTLVPHPLRMKSQDFAAAFLQQSSVGSRRDYMLTIYDNNLIFAMGSMGGLLVLYLLGRLALTASTRRHPEGRFWLWFVLFCGVLGIAVNPDENQFGVAAICGQPLILLGISFLAALYLTLPAVLRWLGLLGCLIDFSEGVFLHFTLENRTWSSSWVDQGPHQPRSFVCACDLSQWARHNWQDKCHFNLSYWGDHFVGYTGAIQFAILIGFGLFLVAMSWKVFRAHKASLRGPRALADVAHPQAGHPSSSAAVH